MPSSRNAESSPALPVALGAAALVALLLVGAWWWRRPGVESQPLALRPAMPKIVGEAIKPTPRPAGYVGSQTCANCHEAIAQSYAAHPMHRSAGSTPGLDDVENFNEGLEFTFDDGRRYRVEKRPDAIYHHETLLDKNNEVIYHEVAKIRFFIGSGTRGKSYAIDRDGLLFQSPVSWYSGEQKWDLSPGYAHRHARFGRRIGEECILCHAGRPTTDADRDKYFPQPVLLEAAIGCERCHGPGKEHVALHESPRLASSPDPIVNPAKLPPDRREAVCYQCHLIGKARIPRYGRTFADFRPGDRLDDVWATMVAAASVRGDGKTKSVSHVEQMRESACFMKSEGRLGCVSCHDPHSMPVAAEATAYYRQKCLDCHSQHSCSLPEERQAAPPANNSCAHCHMPRLSAHDIAHASQTDHRILRVQEEEEVGLLRAESDDLVPFDADGAAMPFWESQRLAALSKVRRLQESGYASPAAAEELRQSLTMIADIAADDALTWAGLAAAAELQQDNSAARKNWEQALRLRPNDETALQALAGLCQKTGDYQAGLAYSDRLIELNPWKPRDYMRRASMRAELGAWSEAIADAEMSVKLDPLDKHARRWLIDAYQRRGELDAGRRHAEILRRLAELPVPPG